MRLNITMDQVAVAKEPQSAGQLLEEMANNDLVEGTSGRVGVFGNHISCIPVIPEGMTTLDEEGQVTQGTVLHDQMYMGGGFITVEEGDDVGMIEALEDLNLGR